MKLRLILLIIFVMSLIILIQSIKAKNKILAVIAGIVMTITFGYAMFILFVFLPR